MRQIFLDTETTGLSPESGDRIVEIGCVEMIDRRLSGRSLRFYVNPERSSHEDARKVHGLEDDFLKEQPRFEAIADELLEFISGAEIIIHNASFDIGFLNVELKRIGRPPIAGCVGRITCSLLMARDTYPGKSNSLDALCKRLEVNNSNRTLHGALLDAGLLAEVYIRMTRGQESLVIDGNDSSGPGYVMVAVDYSALDLIVIEADEDEFSAHQLVIAELDKASAGRALWHRFAA